MSNDLPRHVAPNDARHDAPEHDMTSVDALSPSSDVSNHVDRAAPAITTKVATSHDVTRSDVTQREVASQEIAGIQSDDAAPWHDASQTDIELARRKSDYRLTVHQIMERLDLEGLSKSKRTVQRWLKNGDIDAVLVDTANGRIRLANELDTARFIEDLKRKEALALSTQAPTPLRDMARQDVVQHAPIGDTQPNTNGDYNNDNSEQVIENLPDQPSANIQVLEERVAQLSDRLDDYRSENSFLKEQISAANDHVKLWSDRAQELKQLLESQQENIRPVLGAMARSLDTQQKASSQEREAAAFDLPD